MNIAHMYVLLCLSSTHIQLGVFLSTFFLNVVVLSQARDDCWQGHLL